MSCLRLAVVASPTVLLLVAVSAGAQAPAIIAAPVSAGAPVPAVTYYSGPKHTVFIAWPRNSAYGATPLPPMSFPGYTISPGVVSSYLGLGIFRPRGIRTYYRPGYVYPPASAP
jgi:hypothetical protein